MSSLATCTWQELEATGALLAVPIGSTEQHGPHLPLSTDTDIADGLARRLERAVNGVMVAPPLAYGSSGEHQGFPGTISIGQAATEQVLVELARSAGETFPRILLISTHGGNAGPVERAVLMLRAESRDVRAWSPAGIWSGDAHAGHVETAVMLALAPDRVRMTIAELGDVRPLTEIIGELQRRGVRALSPTGVLGDPRRATAADGEVLLAAAERELVVAVRSWGEAHPVWL